MAKTIIKDRLDEYDLEGNIRDVINRLRRLEYALKNEGYSDIEIDITREEIPFIQVTGMHKGD